MPPVVRRALLSPWKLALLLAALLALYQVRLQHLDDRLYYALSTAWHAERWASNSLWLPDYRVAVEAKVVAGVKQNFSGLSYDADRKQLWAVLNNPEQLLRLSLDGELLERYPLSGFEDVEDVVYLGDDRLLLVEERKQALVVVPAPVGSGAIVRDGLQALTLGIGHGDNRGFEGVGYDRAGDRLFVVKESSPRKLYEIHGLRESLVGRLDLQVIDRQAWIDRSVFARDLSAVHFDPRTGHLVLLSDESRLLMELGREGELVSFRSLGWGAEGQKRRVPQPEGLTFDEQGNLYLASEPNLLYRLQRP